MRTTLAATALLPVALLTACTTTSKSTDPAGKATSAASSAAPSSSTSSSSDPTNSSSSSSSSSSSAPASSPSSSTDSSLQDEVFDSTITRINAPAVTKDRTKAKKNAHQVCSDLTGGKAFRDELNTVASMYPSLGMYEKGQFVGLAIGSFCPKQLSKVRASL